MQRRLEGDVRISAERLAQRQRAIGGELGEQSIGQGPQAFILFFLGRRGLNRGVDRRGGLGGRRHRRRIRVDAFVSRGDLGVLNRRFVLWADIAALDAKTSGTVDAHEGAGARDILGRIDDGALLEGLQRRLDLGKTGVDLLRKLVCFRIGRLKLIRLRTQRLARGQCSAALPPSPRRSTRRTSATVRCAEGIVVDSVPGWA